MVKVIIISSIVSALFQIVVSVPTLVLASTIYSQKIYSK